MSAAAIEANYGTLADELGKYAMDPFGFVNVAFDWGVGALANYRGPDAWQEQFLRELGAEIRRRNFRNQAPVDPIRMAIASGHGIGKSTLFAWLHWFIMNTRPHAKGRVTANTYTQLETTTWAEIQRWGSLLINAHWWDVTRSAVRCKLAPDAWFSVPITCAEENSEAFAGQHNAASTSFFLFDESSLIPDKIWEVAEAGLTDGEPMWFAAGNPTRNTGEFYEICFGKKRQRRNVRSIDSRTCKFPNHDLHNEWIADHGIDSDFVRVRILGQPPHQAEDQLIGRVLVNEAQSREIEPLASDPLVAGVDVPDGGSAWFVVRFRRGLDTRPGPFIPRPIRIAGSQIDRETMIQWLARILATDDERHRVSAMFVDSAFGAPIVERLHMLGFDQVQEITFGGKSPDPRYGNMRAYMWGKELREWLRRGAIDREDKWLEQDLLAPGFHYRVAGDGAMIIESKAEIKARGIEKSIDDGDSLALTFARPVAPLNDYSYQRSYQRVQPQEGTWMLNM